MVVQIVTEIGNSQGLEAGEFELGSKDVHFFVERETIIGFGGVGGVI